MKFRHHCMRFRRLPIRFSIKTTLARENLQVPEFWRTYSERKLLISIHFLLLCISISNNNNIHTYVRWKKPKRKVEKPPRCRQSGVYAFSEFPPGTRIILENVPNATAHFLNTTC